MALVQEEIKVSGYEKIVYAEEKKSGLSAIIAVHNTALGPACGGVRMLDYSSREEALEDVVRLSKGMTYKSSIAEIGFGGGKSVIIGDPSQKTPELFHAMGEFVGTFNGSYFAAKDMNITSEDLSQMKTKTKHVLGIVGEFGSSGDPSPVTARGLLAGLKATMEQLTGSQNLSGVKIAIQGIGHVGYTFAGLVKDLGAELWVSDIDSLAVEQAEKEFGAHGVGEEEIYGVDCDIFSPNARGAILNPQTITQLKCKAIVGAANNQLLDDSVGHELHKMGILYAPDVAVNSGGIINIFVEYVNQGYVEQEAFKMADAVYDRMSEIFARAKKEGLPPFVVTHKIAEERIQAVSN